MVACMLSNSSNSRPKGKRRGSAIVEFALGFSVLWACLAGIFQFSHAMYVYNALTIAIHNGSQYAAFVEFDSASNTFVQKIKNQVVYGTSQGGGNPLLPGLGINHVSVVWTVDASGIPQTITTSIQNFSSDTVFQTFTWTGKPSATVRFMGRYTT
jgi:hypothetical protein